MTSLSAGLIVHALLSQSQALQDRVTSIFPVMYSDDAELPYIVYRRAGLDQTSSKAVQMRYCDAINVELVVVSGTYSDGIEIAELVRDVLDGAQCDTEDLSMRSCRLVDAEENFDGAYQQIMTFNIRC